MFFAIPNDSASIRIASNERSWNSKMRIDHMPYNNNCLFSLRTENNTWWINIKFRRKINRTCVACVSHRIFTLNWKRRFFYPGHSDNVHVHEKKCLFIQFLISHVQIKSIESTVSINQQKCFQHFTSFVTFGVVSVPKSITHFVAKQIQLTNLSTITKEGYRQM